MKNKIYWATNRHKKYICGLITATYYIDSNGKNFWKYGVLKYNINLPFFIRGVKYGYSGYLITWKIAEKES